MALQKYGGMDVILSSYLTETKTEEVKRTIKERLFSLPWRPFKKTKTITVQVPQRGVFKTEFGLCMHPAIWEEIKKAKGDL